MKEIRKIDKTVSVYEKIIKLDPEYARRRCEEFLEKVEHLEHVLLFYSKSTQAMFLVLCEDNVQEAEYIEDASLLDIIIQKINMQYYGWKLNKLSLDILKFKKLEKRVKKVKQRLIQFKYL